MPEISHSLQQVLAEISRYEHEFARQSGSTRLIAVSKTRPVADLLEAYQQGLRAFGENYIQEALEKIASLDLDGIEWHFIGPIQSNKTRPIAEHFDWVHSVDRLKVAERLSEQRPTHLAPLQVLIQVNSSNEESKSGCSFEQLPQLAAVVDALPQLNLRGLMTLPATAHDINEQRVPFRKLHDAMASLNQAGMTLDTLSMGMSRDIRAAIAEGSNMVRVGTAIFGQR